MCCLLKLLKGSGRQDGLNELVGRLDDQSGEIFSAADKLVRREEPLHVDKMAGNSGTGNRKPPSVKEMYNSGQLEICDKRLD